ncbi:MAG: SDR family NAD(P)-dependent oxidoreductase, partial [Bacteroidetes bacterium]|nr:SDR family NAD(P)-dependent oxidoreductase [Bacteroidota bacterium]
MLSLGIQGKTALVAGSTQGIGFAAAEALASLGANCVLISRNEEKLKSAAARLDTAQGQKHSYLVADFQKPDVVESVVSNFLQNHNIDILVNNTGGPAGGPITDATPEQFLAA